MTYPLVVDLARDGFPVSVTCRVLGFSSLGFYKWQRSPVSRRDYDDAVLTNAARDMRLDLQANVTENLHCLHETLTEFSVSRPQGGTFATINVVDTGLFAFQVRSELLQRGIAVSSGSSFYSDIKLGNEIIRIALARPVEVFRESMARLSPLPVRNYR